MAGKPAPSVLVAFLGHNDFVDEPAAEGIKSGQPRDFDAGEPPLQGLEQGHEIPNGEDVVFHEQAQRVQPVDFLVNGMVQQPGPDRREAFLNLVESIHGDLVLPLRTSAAEHGVLYLDAEIRRAGEEGGRARKTLPAHSAGTISSPRRGGISKAPGREAHPG
jgi:hypothetical protein